jgi:myo-inositol 2-dehydrogenase/D-chiro-inositol 1-dehydrogenase
METTSGVLVDVEAYMDCGYGYEVKAEMVCESGSILLTPNPAVRLREAGQEVHAVEPDWRERFRAGYREQIAGWVGSILTGRPSGASAWDGYAASLTAQACLDAWRSGDRVKVEIPESPALYR